MIRGKKHYYDYNCLNRNVLIAKDLINNEYAIEIVDRQLCMCLAILIFSWKSNEDTLRDFPQETDRNSVLNYFAYVVEINWLLMFTIGHLGQQTHVSFFQGHLLDVGI